MKQLLLSVLALLGVASIATFGVQPAHAASFSILSLKAETIAMAGALAIAEPGEVEDDGSEIEDETDDQGGDDANDDQGADQEVTASGDDSDDDISGETEGDDGNSGETEGDDGHDGGHEGEDEGEAGEGEGEGQAGEGEGEGEGQAGEGEGEGQAGEGEGEGEGQTGEGEGEGEGQTGEGEGEGEGQATGGVTLDRIVNGNNSYTAGTTATVDVTITSTVAESFTALGLTETLPAGWTLNTVVNALGAAIVPATGSQGTIDFVWVSIPVLPVTVEYTVDVPADATGDVTISGEVLYRTTSSGGLTSGVVTTTVGTVAAAGARSMADTNKDWQINLSEALRTVQLYNSGQFHCQDGTEDGFAPGAGDQSCTGYDVDHLTPDWKVELSELLRLVQFYNSKGHAYHVHHGSEDGFAPGVYAGGGN